MDGAIESVPVPGPGPRVRFRLSEVFLPPPERVRELLEGSVELIGTLVALSDSGDRPGEFGIVRLSEGINVVVPVTALDELHQE